MKNTTPDKAVLVYDKKFGVITQDQIIINDSLQKKISFESIKKVKLVKNRIFYTNFTFLFFAILSAVLLYLYFELHFAIRIVGLLLSMALFLYTFRHKFYQYKIVIKLNNDEMHTIVATQLHRHSIKEFYYVIYKQIKQKKEDMFITVNPVA